MKRLLDKRGEGYIETVVLVVAATMFIVCALNVFSFFVQRQKLDYFAKELTECASTFGKTSGKVDERYEELCEEFGIRPACDFSGTEYFDESKKTVQLGETIRVRLTLETSTEGTGIFTLPVSITAVHSGLSEQYWK